MFLIQRLDTSPFPPDICNRILELLPPRPIQPITQFSIPIHLRPAIPAPITPRHIYQKIAMFLLVMNTQVRTIAACPRRKGVYASLRHERGAGSDPGLVCIEVFETVLFLVFPLHVLLFVEDGVPPDIEQTICPVGAAHKEGAKIEAAAVLREDEVYGRRVLVAGSGSRDGIEVDVGWRVGDVQGVIVVNVAVGVVTEVFEDVVFERVGVFHDKGV